MTPDQAAGYFAGLAEEAATKAAMIEEARRQLEKVKIDKPALTTKVTQAQAAFEAAIASGTNAAYDAAAQKWITLADTIKAATAGTIEP